MQLSEIKGCVIIPTYNNQGTLKKVISDVLKYVDAKDLIIVNDGSTDDTSQILEHLDIPFTVLANEQNKGKGNALRKGFKKAIELGYSNAITIDSDGQHFAYDIPKLINASKKNAGAVIMGSRNMMQDGVPQKSSFGNKFSNFWFKVETWITLPDTQTGFRVYPLEPLKKMRLFTNKFELEIEVIVRLAWKNIPFFPVKIDVKYDPEERVSHFRPGRDFFRISVLNSVLVIFALLYYYPKKLFSLKTLKLIKNETLKPEESNLNKSFSLAFGVLMGILPIWGFQLLIGIPLAVLFKLNKVLFIAAANISIPPMIPIILYLSLLVGQFFVGGNIAFDAVLDLSSQAIKNNLYLYTIGAVILAFTAALCTFFVSFLTFTLFRKD